MKNRKAFTLIELLVVIAIIAILAAILFPMFAAAKERAKLAGCTSNMKSIFTAITLYADENNGCLPRVPLNLNGADPQWQEQTYGFGDLWKYVRKGNIFLCPNAQAIKPGQTAETIEDEHIYKLYYDYDRSGKTVYAKGSYHFWPQVYAVGDKPARLDANLYDPELTLNKSFSAASAKKCRDLGGPIADNFFLHSLVTNNKNVRKGVLTLAIRGHVKFLPADSYPFY